MIGTEPKTAASSEAVPEVTIEIEDKLRKSWAESMDSLHGISLIPYVD